MTTTLSPPRTRQRARHASVAAPQQVSPRMAVILEEAAQRARRQPTISLAVRAAWDVLVMPGAEDARAAWSDSLRHRGTEDTLFATACLASLSPSAVAGSLYRAASGGAR